jgi:hypothetical protein
LQGDGDDHDDDDREGRAGSFGSVALPTVGRLSATPDMIASGMPGTGDGDLKGTFRDPYSRPITSDATTYMLF